MSKKQIINTLILSFSLLLAGCEVKNTFNTYEEAEKQNEISYHNTFKPFLGEIGEKQLINSISFEADGYYKIGYLNSDGVQSWFFPDSKFEKIEVSIDPNVAKPYVQRVDNEVFKNFFSETYIADKAVYAVYIPTGELIHP